ncbi:MAG TPA: hypothetical protein VML50_18300, partial [Anaeromyxobacter sp.]|nr:hypothetical protein [Anaeromyxobacter sp.]
MALLEGAAIATLLVLLVRSRAAASPEHRDLERLELLTRASARDELARLLSSRLGGPLASVVNNLGAARRLL